jgi:hypothetical protein
MENIGNSIKSTFVTIGNELNEINEKISEDIKHNNEKISEDIKHNNEKISEDIKRNNEKIKHDAEQLGKKINDDFNYMTEKFNHEREHFEKIKNDLLKKENLEKYIKLLKSIINVAHNISVFISSISIGLGDYKFVWLGIGIHIISITLSNLKNISDKALKELENMLKQDTKKMKISH